MSVIEMRRSGWLFCPLFLVFCSLSGCTGSPEQHSETREQMGTLVSITVLSPGRAEAVARAFAEIDRLERMMSTYIEESEISRLNREGSVAASGEMLDVVERALHFHRISGGAFDISVKPVLDLHEESFERDGNPPGEAELAAAADLLDGAGVRIDDGTIVLAPGAGITLDAIAKGYIVDRAVETLRSSGVEHALVNAGGDVRALGDKGGVPWRVALQNPRDPADYLAVIDLIDRSVATSGDYRRYFEPTLQHHHILDPRTGSSARELISVTVTAETAMDADALSTTVFVLGAERGLALVESRDGVEALVVTADREVLQSSGW